MQIEAKIYEVIGGKRAYDSLLHGKKKLNEFQMKQKILKGPRPEIDFPIKKGLQQMIEKCWSEDPKERSTFDELFKKLSLSNEDYFLEFEGNYEEPKIISDDEDDDESCLCKKFRLEDVDNDELLDCVDEIKEEASARGNEEIKRMGSTIKEQSDEIEAMKKKVSEQADKISSLQKGILAILKGKQKTP